MVGQDVIASPLMETVLSGFFFFSKPGALDALQDALDNVLAHWRIRKNEREFIDRTVNDIVLS
jgi:hypothetical protein